MSGAYDKWDIRQFLKTEYVVLFREKEHRDLALLA